MRILIVKLSSLGDVVHTFPAVQDIRRALPQAQIDWVVEPGFAPLVQRCAGVQRVIPCHLRQWRTAPFGQTTRQEWQAFKADLQATAYDAVMDLQGLTKSALIARLARVTPAGLRYAMANGTDGSAYEAPTRWLAHRAIAVTPQFGAVQRGRELCAKALGYALKSNEFSRPFFGLYPQSDSEKFAIKVGSLNGVNTHNQLLTITEKTVVLVHGTSRDDKLWPEASWVALGQRLMADGFGLALPYGNAPELARSERLAQALPGAVVWPRLGLDALTDAMSACAGVIGVDSGLSHIAVALDLPHVQLYNFDTAWRTGPPPDGPRQRSVFAQPAPPVDAVWAAWLAISTPRVGA